MAKKDEKEEKDKELRLEPKPEMLGSGQAKKAAKLLQHRNERLEELEKKALGY